jgi:predicted metal-binding membrane protein
MVSTRGPGIMLWAGTGAAWLVLLATRTISGIGPLPHHGTLGGVADGGQHLATQPAGLAAWMVMVVATMLPSAAPTMRLLGRAGRRGRSRTAVGAVVLGAYLATWLGFGVLALPVKVAVHAADASWSWPDQRPALLAAGTAALAGLYQLSPGKRRCLAACLSPRELVGGLPVGRGWQLGLRSGQ